MGIYCRYSNLLLRKRERERETPMWLKTICQISIIWKKRYLRVNVGSGQKLLYIVVYIVVSGQVNISTIAWSWTFERIYNVLLFTQTHTHTHLKRGV